MITAAGIAPWLGIGMVCALAALLGVALRILQTTTDMPAETIRKLFHLGGGAVALTLPWLFDVLWPVLALGIACMIVFVILRVVPTLHEGPGQVLQAVPRHSMGEFWFLLGVTTAYAIAGNDVVVYSICILILAVADTAAALVGVFYGKHTFDVPGGTKTREGSGAFLLMAFLCVHVPVLLFTDVGRLESLLTAINLGLLMMLAEADAARGSDNFVVPVLVVLLLKVYLGMNAMELGVHFGAIACLSMVVFIYRNDTTLSTDALIGATLAGYAFWLFGGWRWVIAPVVMFATYTWLVGRPRLAGSRLFNADVLLAIAAPGLLLVTAFEVFGSEILYLPFVAVWSANLAVIGTLHRQFEAPDGPALQFASINTLKSLVVMVPGVLASELYQPWGIAATLLSVPFALAAFALADSPLQRLQTQPAAWWNVSVSVGAGTLASFALLGLVKRLL